MTWNELITQLKTYDNCSVDCGYMIVQDLHAFICKQESWYNEIKSSGVEISKVYDAPQRKKILEILLNNIISGNTFPVNKTPLRPFSIFPLK